MERKRLQPQGTASESAPGCLMQLCGFSSRSVAASRLSMRRESSSRSSRERSRLSDPVPQAHEIVSSAAGYASCRSMGQQFPSDAPSVRPQLRPLTHEIRTEPATPALTDFIYQRHCLLPLNAKSKSPSNSTPRRNPHLESARPGLWTCGFRSNLPPSMIWRVDHCSVRARH